MSNNPVIFKYFSEQKLSPKAVDVIKLGAKQVLPEGSQYVFLPATEPGPGVINFGGEAKGGVRCLSPRQIQTQTYAVSFVTDALDLYLNPIQLPKFDLRVAQTAETTRDTLRWMMTHGFDKPIVVDLENAPDRSVLTIACTYGREVVVFGREVCSDPELLREIVQTLGQHYYIIGHNWKYDAGILLDATGIKVPVWYDTMLAHHALNPSASGHHRLETLAERLLGVADWSKGLKKYTGTGDKADYSKIPDDVLCEYNGYDVYYTFAIFTRLLPTTHEAAWTEFYWANGFIDIEHHRVRVDVEYITELREQLMAEEQGHLAKLPEGINPNSPKQLKDMFADAGVALKSTSKDVLEEYKDDEQIGHLVTALLDYRKVNKSRGTYCDAYLRLEKDGYIRTTINIHGTASGRMSGSNPNLQNVTRSTSIRRIFTARSPERVLVEADYGQAELRVQALYSQDERMISLFQPDAGDYFDNMMPQAFPNEFPTLQDYLKYEEEFCDGDEKEYRAKLKGVVYGLNFGRGARAIAKALDMEVREAQGIIDRFMQSQPRYAQWRNAIMQAAVDPAERRRLTGPYGLQFQAEVIDVGNFRSIQRSALSFLPQNAVSYLCTTAAVRTNDRLKREGLDALVVLAVHDAIYVDTTRELAQQVSEIVQEEMQRIGVETFGDQVLFTTDAHWSYRWGEHEDSTEGLMLDALDGEVA